MIYHYFGGGSSGVARFHNELQRIFPEMKLSMRLPELKGDCIVITDNHLANDVPRGHMAVVVHHGCAATHYNRDDRWRTPRANQILFGQEMMFHADGNKYVAPSAWIAEEFAEWNQMGSKYRPTVIPHYVDPIPQLPKSGKPVIIGDWRDNNKGSNTWRKIAARCPQWEFQPLNFRDDAGKRKQYGEASLYLCLSLSEGGSYSMCDAEAAELPICTTDVGNYGEFSDCEVIPWQERNNADLVIAAIEKKLSIGRCQESFYKCFTFDKWAEAWRAVVQ